MQNIWLCCCFPVSSDPSTTKRIFSALPALLWYPLPQFVIVHTSQMDNERKPNTSLVLQGSPTFTLSNHPHPCDTHSCCASHIQTSYTPPYICHKHTCFLYLQSWKIEQLISAREDVFYLVNPKLLFSNFPLISLLPFCHSLLKSRYFTSLACFWSCLKCLVGRKKSSSGIQSGVWNRDTEGHWSLLCPWQVYRTTTSVCKAAGHVKGQDMLGEGHSAQALPARVTMLEKKGWIFFGRGLHLQILLDIWYIWHFFISFSYLQHFGGQTELSPQL